MPAALAGFLALAAAMGIGRFAFTPVLPLMQQQQLGLSLAAGGVLAAANYAGYLAGALACTLWRPRGSTYLLHHGAAGFPTWLWTGARLPEL